MDNGTLSISGINKEHEGIYQCIVSNDVGPSLQKSASLRVIGEKVWLINMYYNNIVFLKYFINLRVIGDTLISFIL